MLLSLPLHADEIFVRVVRVADGDTITILVSGDTRFVASEEVGSRVPRDRTSERIRLHGIDALERGQPFGRAAGRYLSGLVANRDVRVEYTNHDRYGRIVGIVFLDDRDINLEMLKAGLAWHYKRYDSTPAYAQAEAEARAAKRELFVQFLMRIYKEISGCIIGQFSTLKHLQGPYFKDFRESFLARLERSFVVPANTFDNVKGKFPIGFFIWSLSSPQRFTETQSDVYIPQKSGCQFLRTKCVSSYEHSMPLNDWLRATWENATGVIGYLACNGNDFQHQNEIAILSAKNNETSTFFKPITKANVLKSCIYLAVRHAIEADWLNDRDQFICPNEGWQGSSEFQSDCIAFTLFHGQNRITSQVAENHWIPFTENEVDAQGLFKSHFMSDFLSGKVVDKVAVLGDLFKEAAATEKKPIAFSAEARAVMNAGRELWRYYHSQPGANLNASFYDIRLYFQGSTTDAKGKTRMNNESSDAKYTALIGDLRMAMKKLARRIKPKVYEYGFLKS